MRHLLTFLFTLCSLGWIEAREPIVIKLWPDGAPNDNEMRAQARDGALYVAEPTLTVFPAERGNGLAIVACPGGGYWGLAMEHEGTAMADWMNRQGITYAVLRYRMPNGHHEVPLSDAQGPDFQILFYPVITMDPAFTHMGSRDNLLGKNPSGTLEEKYSNERQVRPDTPPAFILHCTDDDVVPVANAVAYYSALARNGVSASLHIYPTGGHGWGYNDSYAFKRQWTGELEKWLQTLL